MKQLKSIQVPKQFNLLDKFISEKSVYSDRNFFLNQYRAINRLLKLNYPHYYIYNYNLYAFLKKFFYLNTWRFYLKPLSVISVLTPFYTFLPQIQLKEFLFYKHLSNYTNIKKLHILNKRQFCISPYLKVKTKYFTKVLPGGLNSLILCDNSHIDFLSLIDPTSLTLKKVINFPNNYINSLLLSELNIIFLISLYNYTAFYKVIIWNILVRL